MIRLSQAEQRGADSGFCFEMVGTPRLVDQQALDLRLRAAPRAASSSQFA